MTVDRFSSSEYAEALERRIDSVLFVRGGLALTPAAPARLAREALDQRNRRRAEWLVVTTQRVADERPRDRVLAAAAAHARALLESDPTAIQRAAAEYPDQWSRGAAIEDAATVLVGRGDTASARRLLEKARGSFEAIGAVSDLDRVHATLRRLGARPHHWTYAGRPAYGWDGLTDTEIRVANLVSEGLTNREVAERMYLSPHTVAFHLRQIFRKLEIDSRVQLTRTTLAHCSGSA
jgi:DNA-binding CsgD family transcriptional regulator